MIALLAKANDWFSRLKSGECKSISELANEDGSSNKYICRIMPVSASLTRDPAKDTGW